MEPQAAELPNRLQMRGIGGLAGWQWLFIVGVSPISAVIWTNLVWFLARGHLYSPPGSRLLLFLSH